MRHAILAATAACTLAAAPLAAQVVGHVPSQSPFRDLDFAQELTFYSGYYKAKKDPAQVAPQSGPILGVHYQWRAGGPVSITADLSRLATERRVLDPEASETCSGAATESCKLIDTYRWPVYFADAGVALNVTGSRSYFRMVPQLRGGIGFATDFHTKPDVGDFAFGTRFAFQWGAGIIWAPGGRYQLRVDYMNHLYSLKYPELYYRPAEDNSTVLSNDQDRGFWLNSPRLTLGVSYLFSR
jgi:opacity protein-like surface antigen